jgi:23S rRNA pseudouridine2605 synthase
MVDSQKLQRIQKFLSTCGVCSRRKGEEAVRKGLVTINGRAAAIGQLVNQRSDVISFEGEIICIKKQQQLILIALNKPRGYVCTHSDPNCHVGDTIYSLLPLYRDHKLICCGRLDKESEGLVLLTNDGNLAAQLSHPSSGISKHYNVEINVPLREVHRRAMLRGIDADGEALRISELEYLTDGHRRLHIVLHEGRKRHIRRMLEHFNYEVKRLERYQIGQFRLDKIPIGHYQLFHENHLKKLLAETTKLATVAPGVG